MAAQCMKSSSGPPSHSPRRAASCTRHGLTSRPVNRTCQGVGTGARWVDRGTGAAGPAWLVVREPRGRPAEAIPRTRRPRSRTRRRPRALFWVDNTRVHSKVRSLANLAAASATCQPAAAARRSQARRGAHPPQDAWVHLRPGHGSAPPAHGRLPTRVREKTHGTEARQA
jgi:hypothetical protein